MYCLTEGILALDVRKESTKYNKVQQIEREILDLSVDNAALAPLTELTTHPTKIKNFRKLFHCLPSFVPKASREDSIFGTARYIAYSFGFLLDTTPSSNLLDTPPTTAETKQLWRQAAFLCRCLSSHPVITSSIRTFYAKCTYLIPATQNKSQKYALAVINRIHGRPPEWHASHANPQASSAATPMANASRLYATHGYS